MTTQIDPMARQTPETKDKKHSSPLSKRSVVSIVIVVALVLVVVGIALPVSRITVVVHNVTEPLPSDARYAITVTVLIDGHDKGQWVIQPGDEVAVGTWFVKAGTHTVGFIYHVFENGTYGNLRDVWNEVAVWAYFGATVHSDLN